MAYWLKTSYHVLLKLFQKFQDILNAAENIYLFILAEPGLRCGMRDLLVAVCGLLSCGMHAGSSSLIRDWTQAPCIGSVESYPVDHQGSPQHIVLFLFCFIFVFVFFEFYFIYFLYGRFLLVIHFIHISVYMSIPISQFITPPPAPATFPPWCPYVCSLHLCLNFCPANRFICTIFLGSTYNIVLLKNRIAMRQQLPN